MWRSARYMLDGSDAPGRMKGRDPACQIAELDALEPSRRHPAGEFLLSGESSDALHQILIGAAILRHNLAEHRQDLKGIKVVEPVEDGNRDMAEFEAEKTAAGLEDPSRFRQRVMQARQIPQSEGDRVGIERPIGER